MKIHNDFTLYFRVVPSGKRVVYYYAYDENGKRLYGRFTGETGLTAARRKCNQLFKTGLLTPEKNYIPTFAEYAEGWWDWDKCGYLKRQRKLNDLTKNYADKSKRILDEVLLPYFGKMPVNKITLDVVEAFRDSLIEKKYKNSTVNSYYSVLKTMLIEAEERGVIEKNPTAKLRKLKKNYKAIKIITREEFKKLFSAGWEKIWENDRIAYTFNLLAAVTGMRASEVLGLKGSYVFDEHIYLCMQYDSYGYRPTKTKDKCNIPVPAYVTEALNELKKTNGNGFVFSNNGGGKPVTRAMIYYKFEKALNNIGITTEEMRERKIHLHAWL